METETETETETEETWVIDLDGVVWLTGEALPGVSGAVHRLRQAGISPLYVTNNSSPTHEELLERLERCGIEATAEDVVSSADAVAMMVRTGDRVMALADEGVSQALRARGAEIVTSGQADAVVVGWTRRFDFDTLASAARAVHEGATLLGTNEDPTHPTPSGLLPGSGALLEAVAVASGTRPRVAGKPHQPIVDVIRQRRPSVAWAVGDRPSTDGVLARQLGARFGLVLSGVTGEGDDHGQPAPDRVDPGLAALVDALLPL